MCILFVAKGVHPAYPLLIAANRDEFFDRPSTGIHYWEDFPKILAGRDRQAGGSWLGINKDGRIAAVTNVRLPRLSQSGARSRGELVSRWLGGNDTPAGFETFLDQAHMEFNPFNLLYGDVQGLSLYSSITPGRNPVEDGFTSISNGHTSEKWPKMSRGVRMLEGLVGRDRVSNPDDLLNVMMDNSRADWSSLGHSGIPVDYEEALSSIFVDAIEIRGRVYGTRTTSILSYNGQSIEFTEYDHGENRELRGRRKYIVEISG